MGISVSEIQFAWKGKQYTVKGTALGRKYIVLPNRKVLRPTHWLTGIPVVLGAAEEVAHHLEHASIGEIAEHMGNAILAYEVD